MQSESFRSYEQTRTPKREELGESRERVKLEGRAEGDEDQLSQPSTVHSLSNLEEHSTPEKTPTSAEILQKGWQKTTDAIAQGVEGIKNLLTSSQERMDQAKESISQEASNLQGDMKQKASELKGKMTEKFGEEIQPEKDLDQDVKEQIKEINEEIKQQPHGEEEIVEGQGQGKDLSSGKLGEMKDKFDSQKKDLKETSKEFLDKASQKVDLAKSKMTEKFGEEIQPEKDLDQEVKEQIKEINEEIKHQPHGEEEVVEGQGQGKSEGKGFSSGKMSEMKEKFGSQAQDLKQGSQQMLDKASDKLGEMKDKASQQAQPLKEQAQDLSRKTNEKKEEFRSQSASGGQDLKDISKEILDKALGKIGEMREKAGQQGEQLKEGAKEASGEISQKFEQKKSEATSQLKGETSEIEAQEGSKPLTKDNKEEILELAQQLTEKVQELKTSGQLSSEQKSQSSGKQQESQTKSPESHEHHQLSTESPSFKPTEESHILLEKVQEGLEEHVPLTEIVEEIEHGKQSESPKEKGQPALDTLKQGAQDISSKISGKVEEVKNKFSAPKSEEKGEFKQESSEVPEKPQSFQSEQPQSQGSSQPKYSEQQGESQEKSRPKVESLKQGAQDMSGKISEKIEDVKNKFSAPKSEEKGESKQESSELPEKSQNLEGSQPESQERSQGESEEKSQPKMESLKKGAQDLSEKISDKVQSVKDSIGQGKEEGQQEGEQPKAERVPLVDQIMNRIHAVNDNFHQSVENVKNAFKIEERTDERQPLVDVISGRINEATSKISSTIETVKSKVRPSHEEGSQREAKIRQKKESSELPEGGQSLKQKISGGFQNVSNLISQNVENVRERFRSGKEEGEGTEKFHKVSEDEGFSETVKEYKEEKRLVELGGHELVSANPYESLSINEELEKKSLAEKIKNRFRKTNDEDEEIHDVEEQPAEPLKEGQTLKQKVTGELLGAAGKIYLNVDSLKDKFYFGKGKEEGESKQLSGDKPLEQPIESLQKEGESLKQRANESLEGLSSKLGSGKEERAGQEKPLEQPSESLKQGSQPLSEKISGELLGVAGKIYQNIDTLKGKFGSEKAQPKEDIEALDEPAEGSPKEEDQSLEGSKPSLKERVTGSFQGISSQISQGVSDLKGKFSFKGKGEEGEQESEPKPGEFHTVKEGTTETVGELKEEERTEPLLSNNPFEPLETKNVDLAQPLESNEVVGGELKELTANETPGFKVEESSGDTGEGEIKTSFFQKVSSKISGQFNLTKEKVLSAFSHENKENTALLGLIKDIEDKSASQPENEK